MTRLTIVNKKKEKKDIARGTHASGFSYVKRLRLSLSSFFLLRTGVRYGSHGIKGKDFRSSLFSQTLFYTLFRMGVLRDSDWVMYLICCSGILPPTYPSALPKLLLQTRAEIYNPLLLFYTIYSFFLVLVYFIVEKKNNHRVTITVENYYF